VTTDCDKQASSLQKVLLFKNQADLQYTSFTCIISDVHDDMTIKLKEWSDVLRDR